VDSCAAGVALALQTGRNLANDYSTACAAWTTCAAVMALASFAVAVALGLALLAPCGQWWLLGLSAAAIAAAWFYTGGLRPAALTQWPKGLQGSSALLLGALKKPAQTA